VCVCVCVSAGEMGGERGTEMGLFAVGGGVVVFATRLILKLTRHHSAEQADERSNEIMRPSLLHEPVQWLP